MDVGSMRGLVVLEELAGMAQPAPLAAVVERTGLSRTQAFRALQALEHAGFIEHIARRGYRIGVRSIALAAMLGPRPAVHRAVQPVLIRLATATGRSVAMHLRSGDDRVLVSGVAGPRDGVREAVRFGERSPLDRGCSGRVILAHLGDAERTALGAGVDDGRLAMIRARGYDTSFGENHPGLNGVSGPILDESGAPLGSITLAGAASDLDEDSLVTLVRPLMAACRTLSPRVAAVLGDQADGPWEALDLAESGPREVAVQEAP